MNNNDRVRPEAVSKISLPIANMTFGLGLLYMAVGVPLFGIVLHDRTMFWQHIGTTVGVLILAVITNLTKRPSVGVVGMVYLAVVTIIFLVLSGGAFNAGLYLMMPVYIFIFFLTGARLGSRIIFGLFLIFFAAFVLDLAGVIHLPYDKRNFAMFLFSYLLAFVFFVAYARQKDHADAQLSLSIAENQMLVEKLRTEKANVEHKVTERTSELREAQAELMASIRSLPFGYALINRRGHIVFANAQLGQLLRHPIPEYGEQSDFSLDQLAADFAGTIRLKKLIQHSQEKRKQVERNMALGENFFRVLLMPIIDENNNVLGTVFILEDITEQRALERSRDEFFSIASHELRTPLTAIRGNMSMALTYFQKQLKDPDLHQTIVDTHDASVRLIQIVNDFLAASRLEQGRLEFKIEAIDVSDVIHSIAREYEAVLAQRSLRFVWRTQHVYLPFVLADRERTRQVLTNLIGNAVKYTPEKGSIEVHPVIDGNVMKIRIVDSGQGIPLKSRHLLFHKFQQASNNILTRDNTRSTGLGLYISRLMAEGMNGRLYLEQTEVGKGSTFTLELPLISQLRK